MLRSFLSPTLRLAAMALVLLSAQLSRAESFACYPENEIVLLGVPGTYVTEQLTLVNNLDQEITITAQHAADASIGIDIPASFTMKPKEKFSFVISFSGVGEAKGYIVLMQGNTTKRLLVRGTLMTKPGDIKVEEYITFGPIATGKSECKAIEVTNVAATPLKIAYALKGYSNGAFNIPTDDLPEFEIKPGETRSIQVCFTPGEYDAKEELVINYSADGGITMGSKSAWLLGMLEREIDPNLPCLSTNEKVGIGPVMVGQSTDGMIYLLNQTDKPITITSAVLNGIDVRNFELRTPLPLSIDARSKAEMAVTFIPDVEGHQYSAELVLTLESEIAECKSATVQLAGWTTTKAKDDDRYPIFIGERKTIGIEWGANVIMKKVIFFNNLDHDVEVSNVSLRDGIDFRIVETSPVVPCVLKPNENIILVLATGMDGKTYFTDEIIFVTNEDGAAQNYDLQGVKQASSVYDAGNREIELVVGSGPAIRALSVTLRNAATAGIQIHDLTGKLMASSHTASYLWKSGSAGTYFITASGVTTSGKPFSINRMVQVR